MDSKKDKGRASNNGKYVVVLLEEPKEASRWVPFLKGSRLIFFLICAMAVGYGANTLVNRPNVSMNMSEAAKTLGIPMTGKNMLGVTFIKGNPNGDITGFTSKCPNCNYEGITVSVRYPKEPGAGWRAHDLAPVIANMLSTPTIAAREIK